MLLQLIDVPRWFLINLCSCVSVSVGVTRLWYSGMVFMQPGWKWIVHITVMSCCSNSCCQTSVKLLATFAFLHNVCARALSCCDTRLQTSHQGGGAIHHCCVRKKFVVRLSSTLRKRLYVIHESVRTYELRKFGRKYTNTYYLSYNLRKVRM